MTVIKEPPSKPHTLERIARDFAELGKREPQMWVMPGGADWEGNIPTPDHWTFRDFESNGPLEFDRLAENLAIVLGWGSPSEEDARNRLLDEAKDYLVENQRKHNYIKVYPGSTWTGKYGKPKPRLIRRDSVLLYSVCEAVADYLRYLDSQNDWDPAQEANTYLIEIPELDPAPNPPTAETAPSNGSERSDSEIKRDRRVEERRAAMFEFLKRPYLKVESTRDASRALRNRVQLRVLYGFFNEKGIIMISSSAYHGITWFKLKTDKGLQKIHDKKIVSYLVKDMQRNWKRLWDESPQVPQVP